MYWMMMGVNEKKLMIIKAKNMGHTREKNGVVKPKGPHTYRVEMTDPNGMTLMCFTVTHRREDGQLALSRIILKVLEGELDNAERHKDAEPFEIKHEPKVLGDRPLLSTPKDTP